ncbi:hypothetical protein GF337_03815 [candidate division KSB1 bacterium]|nr:hypothetical protein [candidate division KSB1 bacterium]
MNIQVKEDDLIDKLMNNKSYIFVLVLTILLSLSFLHAQPTDKDSSSGKIVTCFKNLNGSSEWRLVERVKQNFQTYHPQGMVKIGDYIYLTSVEKIVTPQRLAPSQDGYDRTPGKGIGHLFKIDLDGNLIDHITLGEGTVYHPGGIDYDGKYIWCPVAEYRPNSKSIIYRIHPDSLIAHKTFHFDDHIGAIVYNRTNDSLHGMSWGSRRFYVWTKEQWTEAARSNHIPKYEIKLNGNHYIGYQDCHYAGDNYALCSGLRNYVIPGAGKISFGGIDLLDLEQHVAVHQIPVYLWVKPHLVMSNNPFFVELINEHLRFYFIPEDDDSTLYIYEIINLQNQF